MMLYEEAVPTLFCSTSPHGLYSGFVQCKCRMEVDEGNGQNRSLQWMALLNRV